ncbi:MAG: peptidoglycan DD-metalloendopeptidase family protein, partial [Bacilli bacterium]|nr:peptidoglycan DD-metalloendopeptidase family protein [Bacilli bacterium]
GINTEPSLGEKAVAGLISGANEIVFGILPESLLVNIFMKHLAPAFGLEDSKLAKERAAAQEELDKINAERLEKGEEALTMKQYQEQLGLGGTMAHRVGMSIGKAVGNFGERVGNLFKGKGWNTDDQLKPGGVTTGERAAAIVEKLKGVGKKGLNMLTAPIREVIDLALGKSDKDYWDIGSSSEEDAGFMTGIKDLITLTERVVLSPVYYTLKAGKTMWDKVKDNPTIQAILRGGKFVFDLIRYNIDLALSNTNGEDINPDIVNAASISDSDPDAGMKKVLFYGVNTLMLPIYLGLKIFHKVQTAATPYIAVLAARVSSLWEDIKNIGSFVWEDAKNVGGLLAQGDFSLATFNSFITMPVNENGESMGGGLKTVMFTISRIVGIIPFTVGMLVRQIPNQISPFFNMLKSAASNVVDWVADVKHYSAADNWDNYWTNPNPDDTGLSEAGFMVGRILTAPVILIGKVLNKFNIGGQIKKFITDKIDIFQKNIVQPFLDFFDLDTYWNTNKGKAKTEDEGGTGSNLSQSDNEKAIKSKGKQLSNIAEEIKSGMGSNISQLDPKVKNIKFGNSTIGDAGCAPATAAMMINKSVGYGSDDLYSADAISENIAQDFVQDKAIALTLNKMDTGALVAFLRKHGINKANAYKLKNILKTTTKGLASKANLAGNVVFGWDLAGHVLGDKIASDDEELNLYASNLGKTDELNYLRYSGASTEDLWNYLHSLNGQGSNINNKNKTKHVGITDVSNTASLYQTKDGGVKANFFNDIFSNYGMKTKYTKDQKDIESNLKSGNPMILLGKDSTNTSKSSSPFGPNPHYVMANGLDKNGNIIIDDPEANNGKTSVYNAKKILGHSTLGISTKNKSSRYDGFGGPDVSNKLANLFSGKGIKPYPEIAYQKLNKFSSLSDADLNTWINKVAPANSPFRNNGAVFNAASTASGLDPRYILAHAAQESGWGTSSICKQKGNYFGIGAFDSSPGVSAYFMGNSLKTGIVEGAKWIAKNYTNQGQDTLYLMEYGNKRYASDVDGWINNISSIMSSAPTNGSATSSSDASSDKNPSWSGFDTQLGTALSKLSANVFANDFTSFIKGSKTSGDDTAKDPSATPGFSDTSDPTGMSPARSANNWFLKKLSGSSITSPYGKIRTINGKTSPHTGIDYGVAGGTPIPSTVSGTVTQSISGNTGFGNHVRITDQFGTEHIYAHMRNKSPLKVGTKVHPGTIIGAVGTTGNSTGNHLHYQVNTKYGTVNPETYLNNYRGAGSKLINPIPDSVNKDLSKIEPIDLSSYRDNKLVKSSPLL